MTSTCPQGHTSASDDYCDVCGAPLGATGGPAPGGAGGAGGAGAGAATGGGGSALDLDTPALDTPAAAEAGRTCPNCSTTALPGALFCEVCGYDFTTGQLPRPLPGDPAAGPAGTPPSPGAEPAGTTPAQEGPVRWVAEVWVDPDWHAVQEVGEPCPSPGMPAVIPLRGTAQLIGRRSVSRHIHPQIDCGADTGVSRRHAQLTTDGQRWWVEDLQSANGTYVGTTGAALPDDPVTPNQRAELPDGARVYVGAWTRIVVREATEEEQAAAGS